MPRIDKVLYTGRTQTHGGRDGSTRSDDGRLDVKLTPPGGAGAGTNPEQLFAAGWSACFIGAMGHAARRMSIAMPADVAVAAEVDLGSGEGGYALQARLAVTCALLTDSELPVDKIARRSGMGNGDRLAKIFRKRLLISPTEYRMQSRREANG